MLLRLPALPKDKLFFDQENYFLVFSLQPPEMWANITAGKPFRVLRLLHWPCEQVLEFFMAYSIALYNILIYIPTLTTQDLNELFSLTSAKTLPRYGQD